MKRVDGLVISENPVFPDTNILLAYVIGYDVPTKVVCLAFEKAKEKDVIVVTNQVMAELVSRAKRDNKASSDRILAAMQKLKPTLVFVKKPTDEELKTVHISDPGDMEILYSARIAGATVILTRDNAWFRDDVFGIDGEIADPHGYLYHDEILTGRKKFLDPINGRIKKVVGKIPKEGHK